MNMYDVILKKRNGEELSTNEINYVVEGYVKGEIPDYQMSAFLMAVYFQKMNKRETVDLTMAMAHSGAMLDLSNINGVTVDKHSTGGVGDKTTLVVGPMITAAGGKLAKMSGRGLGHTGGTIDKLESIPGFKTDLSIEEFIDNVNKYGMAVAGQTSNLDPADKMIYALRDVTATVDSTALIASSIMSKKLASGTEKIVLDIKTGSGAFMKTEKEARELAELMVGIGKDAGRKTVAVISKMDQPLGRAVGNSLEVKEAIESLKGNGPDDLMELCYTLGANMLVMAGISKYIAEAKDRLEMTIRDGSALEIFRSVVKAQGGDTGVINDYSVLGEAAEIYQVKAKKSGYVSKINAKEIGMCSMLLGGGRKEKNDNIDFVVGIYILKKIGDYVEENDVIAEIHSESKESAKAIEDRILASYEFSAEKIERGSVIIDTIV